MFKNNVKAKIRDGQAAVGIFITTRDARLVEVCGHAGFEYALIDAEHYPFTLVDVENLVRAGELVDIPAFVRVPWNRPEILRGYLEVGAAGVMVPMVHSREEAEAAVEAVKYFPLGKRGSAVSRAAGPGVTFKDWAEISNRETMVIIQIEHHEAVDNLSEILEVDGVDAFEIGRADLAQSLGLPGQPGHPTVQEYLGRAVAGVLSAGRTLGDTTEDSAAAADLIAQGYRMVACNLNRLLMNAARSYIDGARGVTP